MTVTIEQITAAVSNYCQELGEPEGLYNANLILEGLDSGALQAEAKSYVDAHTNIDVWDQFSPVQLPKTLFSADEFRKWITDNNWWSGGAIILDIDIGTSCVVHVVGIDYDADDSKISISMARAADIARLRRVEQISHHYDVSIYDAICTGYRRQAG